MHNVWSRRVLARGAALSALMLLAAVVPASAQDRQTRYAIERAQVGVRGKIVEERGGDWGDVTFDQTRTQTWRVSDRTTGVRGAGTHAPGGSNARSFTYEAVVDQRNGKIESVNYDMAGGRGEGRGEGRGGGRDDRRVPRWLVGTFYGRSPSNGRRVTLTVTRDGEAAAVFNNGSREQGTYDNGRLRFNASDVWDVSRVNEGLRAASGSRSEVFTTTQPSRGGGDDDDRDGRVPRWAQGTFRGTTDSGESELIIRADGTATARSLTKNQSYQGTYSNGRLRFDWGTFDVQRVSDGIRTVEVNNRNNQTDYRRTGDY
jgi:hypothetical protein